MRDDVRQVLRELWEKATRHQGMKVKMGYAAAREATKYAVRRIWHAHRYYSAPCKHCWYTQHGPTWRGEDGELDTHEYEPVEGW